MKIFIYILLIIFTNLSAITIKDIKNTENYIWGEGSAISLQQADKRAIKDLVSQISIQVESSFTGMLSEENGNVSEFCKSIVNTYSNTTLHQAERKVIEKKGEVIVYRYIEKEKLKKIFQNRKNKISQYVDSAIKSEKDLRIADALKYYYWSLVLLRSHPDHNEIKYNFPDNDSLLLITELPERINKIFSNLDISIKEQIENKEENSKSIHLLIKYKDNKITNLDYHYWTGDTWTNIISAKDGLGIIDLFGEASHSLKNIKLKCEYIYENKSKVDLELRKVIEDTELPFFSKADFVIPLKANQTKKKQIKIENPNNDCEKAVLEIVSSINCEDNKKVRQLFTNEGYVMFERLIGYGKAEIIQSNPILHSIEINENTIVRSVQMKFSFPGNDRTFIENVVFSFNKEKKIDALSFSLSEQAQKDILDKGDRFGSLQEKYLLIQFMEDYKTAYCLNRIDYLESIFDENALIIVGHILKEEKPIEGIYKSLGNKVEYIKLSKKEYIQRLRRIFQNNEFVNIHFEDNTVKKVGGDDKVYGIQIAQNYYSENYADKGYLFLMIDLNDAQKPKIYVRTWQPTKNEDGSIFGLSDFYY